MCVCCTVFIEVRVHAFISTPCFNKTTAIYDLFNDDVLKAVFIASA